MLLRNLILALCLASGMAIAQQKVPSTMVTATNASWTVLPTNGTLQAVLNTIDTSLAPSTHTNYAPRAITNGSTISVYTPRWSGDQLLVYGTNAIQTQVWQSWGVTTSSWSMVYPVQSMTTTNYDYTNVVAPRWIGDVMTCTNDATNIIFTGFGTSVGTWKKTYAGVP